MRGREEKEALAETALVLVILAAAGFLGGWLLEKKIVRSLSEWACVRLWLGQWAITVVQIQALVRVGVGLGAPIPEIVTWAATPANAFIAGIVYTGIETGWRWLAFLPTAACVLVVMWSYPVCRV